MEFFDFMKTFSHWENVKESYMGENLPTMRKHFDELSDDQIDYLVNMKHTTQEEGLKRASVSEFGEKIASTSFIVFWLFKALEECGANSHEDCEEEDGKQLFVLLERLGGSFYVDLEPKENGVLYKTWVSYDPEMSELKKKEIQNDDRLSDFEKAWNSIFSMPSCKEKSGFISVEDFAFEADDVLISLRSQMYSFLKSEGIA